MTAAIEIEGLRKTYPRRKGSTVAVDGLDLTVPEGGVFGFLGPNGSGKTTTIRCLLGLVRPTGGTGDDARRTDPFGFARRDLHASVRSWKHPRLFLTMSGRENLRLLAAIDGIGIRRVDEIARRASGSATVLVTWSRSTPSACASGSRSPRSSSRTPRC